MPVSVDLLILGGGIQGLALLRELSPEYSALLLDPHRDLSESLHFHGYFSSGWNATNREAATVYRRTAGHWLRLLSKCGLECRETPFYAALPPDTAMSLAANWAGAGIAAVEEPLPPPFAPHALPPHRSYRFDGDLVFDGAAAYRCLSRPVAERMCRGSALRFISSGERIERVVVELDGREQEVTPQLVLCACGAGNARVLAQLPLPFGVARDAQLVRPMHMLLMRGAQVPPVSGFLFDLVFVYHPLGGGEGLWILTLNPQVPEFSAGSIDMSESPPAEPGLVCASLDRLAAAVPEFRQLAVNCRWSLYVGWKTDAPGPLGEPLLQLAYPQPYQLQDFGLENFIALWPNHWCLASAAAADCGRRVREKISPRHRQPHLAAAVPLGEATNKWQRGDLRWREWPAFAREIGYGLRPGEVNHAE